MIRIKEFKILLLIFLIPALLIVIWFKNGNIYGGGEAGLYYHNITRAEYITRWAWADPALGNVVGVGVSGHPTHFVLSKIQQAGVPGFLIQGTVYYFLFVVAGASIFILTRSLFPTLERKYTALAVIFYWFNPISMIGVWNRNLENYRFFFALAPLAFTLFLLGIKKRKYYFSILTVISTNIFAYGLSATPLHIILWFLVFFCSVFYILTSKTWSRKLWIVGYLFSTVAFYVLLNFWWLSQFFSFIFSSSFDKSVVDFFSLSGNLTTLGVLSEKLGNMRDVMRLVHGTFFQNGPYWGISYLLPPVTLLFFFVVVPIFLTVFRNYRNKSVLFLGSLLVMAIFLSKGDAPPLGEIFNFLFRKLTFFQVFRNPFEKFGFILPISASPLFAYGISQIGKRIRVRKVMYILSLILLLGFYGFPFWSKQVFTRIDPTSSKQVLSTESRVPDYYMQANNWLNTKGGQFRILVLPINGEGIDYTWEFPYAGVELSSTLFDVPSISFSTSVSYYQGIADNIERLLLTEDKAQDLFSILNIKYIVVRNDIGWKVREMRNPARIKEFFSGLPYLEHEADFGALSIYSVSESLTRPKIYSPGRLMQILPTVKISDLVKTEFSNGDSAFGQIGHISNTIGIDQVLIRPSTFSVIDVKNNFSEEELVGGLLHVSHLPDSRLYFLLQVKESLARLTIEASVDRFVFDLTHLGKRAMELYLSVKQKREINVVRTAANHYLEIFGELKNENPGQFVASIENPYRSLVAEELNKHYSLIKFAFEVSDGQRRVAVSDFLDSYQKQLVSLGFQTKNPINLDTSGGGSIIVYRFEVFDEGFYDIYLEDEGWNDFYEDIGKSISFQVDGQVVSGDLISNSNGSVIGHLWLDSGVRELMMVLPESDNLVRIDDEELLGDSTENPELKFAIDPFDPFSSYVVSFDYRFEKGQAFDLVFRQDNEPFDNKSIVFPYKRRVTKDRYDSEFQYASFIYTPKKGATTAEVSLIIEPYNDCPKEKKKIIFTTSCEDEGYSRLFDKKTRMLLKNFRVRRIFDNNVFLRQSKDSPKVLAPSIEFKKIDPTEYIVSITAASDPFILTFSELFSPMWEVVFPDGSTQDPKNHFLINSYANGWIVEKKGSYDITLKFAPQRLLDLGRTVSIVAFLSLLVLSIFLWKRTTGRKIH